MGIGEDHGKRAAEQAGRSIETASDRIAQAYEKGSQAAGCALERGSQAMENVSGIAAGAVSHVVNVAGAVSGIRPTMDGASSIVDATSDARVRLNEDTRRHDEHVLDMDRLRRVSRIQREEEQVGAVDSSIRCLTQHVIHRLRMGHNVFNDLTNGTGASIQEKESKSTDMDQTSFVVGVVCNDSLKLQKLLEDLTALQGTLIAILASGATHRECLNAISARVPVGKETRFIYVFSIFENIIGNVIGVHLDTVRFNIPKRFARIINFVGLNAQASLGVAGVPRSGSYSRAAIPALATVTFPSGEQKTLLEAAKWRESALSGTYLHLTWGELRLINSHDDWKEKLIFGASGASFGAELLTFKLAGSGFLTMGYHLFSKSKLCLIGINPALLLFSLPADAIMALHGLRHATKDYVHLLEGNIDSKEPIKLSDELLAELKEYTHSRPFAFHHPLFRRWLG